MYDIVRTYIPVSEVEYASPLRFLFLISFRLQD
jgi:hypothetical protein